jgi:glycosyltransferase involved in cell wall biosynthesis
MNLPLVSVVIPTFNGARWIREAIHSVLEQTYQDFEIVVVDNGSSDNTVERVKTFRDSRIRIISHLAEQGPDFARKVGVHRAEGSIIAYLDQDDRFHRDKLKLHVDLLVGRPDVGFSYNPHFVCGSSEGSVRGIWRPPATLTLEDVVLGFPIAPSVWVMRREWALRNDIWGEDMSLMGREVVICGRLLLLGCKFSAVHRVLNYRRLHAGRIIANLAQCYEAERRCQEIIFSDTRCPAALLAVRGKALMNRALSWAWVALYQGESQLAWRLLREALRIEPNFIAGDPCELVKFLLHNAADNDGVDHESTLVRIFSQLPTELAHISSQLRWAVAHGYLLRAARCFVWGRTEQGSTLLAHAVCRGWLPCAWDASTVVHEFLSYEMEFGRSSTKAALAMFTSQMERLGRISGACEIKACYHFNRGIQAFRGGHRREVVWQLTQAALTRPGYALNRGAIVTMLRALTGIDCGGRVNAIRD